MKIVGASFASLNHLGEACFSHCEKIANLSFGVGLKSIPASAFEGMRSAKVISFDAPLASIGEKAFKNCASLEKLKATVDTRTLPRECFYGAKSLTDFSFLPESFKAPKDAFIGTTYQLSAEKTLSEIVLSGDCYADWISFDQKTAVGLQVVVCGYVPRLSEILNHLNSVEVLFKAAGDIPENCFKDCSSLKRITVEGKIQEIKAHAFDGCHTLQDLQVQFTKELVVGDFAFNECFSLDSSSILNASTSIGDFAFAFNERLLDVTINKNIDSIGNGAFFGCRSIRSISTPILGTATNSLIDFFTGPIGAEVDAGFYSLSSVDAKTAAVPLSLTLVRYKGELVPPNAFAGLSSLVQIDCSSGCSIAAGAFSGCTAVQELKLGSSLSNITGESLKDLVALRKIEFISENATFFSDENGLYSKSTVEKWWTLVRFVGNPHDAPKALSSVERIASYSFVSQHFSTFQLPDVVERIESHAFFNCSFSELHISPRSYAESSFDRCVVDVLGIGDFDELPSCIFGFEQKQKTPPIHSIEVANWDGEDIGQLFFSTVKNRPSLNFVHIRNANSCLQQELIQLENFVKTVEIDKIQVSCLLPPQINYHEIIVNPLQQGITGALSGISSCDTLLIPKINGFISPALFFGNRKARINKLIINDPIIDGGLNNLEIDSIDVSSPDCLSGLEMWGAASIDVINIQTETDQFILFDLQQKTSSEIRVLGEKVRPLAALIKDGVLLRFAETQQSSISIDSTLCKRLAKGSFAGVTALKQLNVGKGVTIEPGAFPDLVNLNELLIDGSLNAPIHNVFEKGVCETLTKIHLSGDIVRKGFCEKLEKLTSVSFDDQKSIGSFAFSGCSSLTNANIPANLQRIGDFAFADCVSLYSLTIPKSIRYIGLGVLAGCTSIESVEVPMFVGHRLKKEGYHPFGALFGAVLSNKDADKYDIVSQRTAYGTRAYQIPKKLKKIVGLALDGVASYGFFSNIQTPIVVLEPLKFVMPYAFENVSSLNGVFVENLQAVGEYGFSGCSINVPNSNFSFGRVHLDSLLSAGDSAFAFKGKSIRRIFAGDLSNVKTGTIGAWFGMKESAILELSCAFLPKIPLKSMGELLTVKGGFKDGIIPNDYFTDLPKLTNIEVVGPISEVGENAFKGLSSLKKLSLTFNSDVSIKKRAFVGLDFTKLGVVFSGVKNIGDYAFSETYLPDIGFIEEAESIGNKAFYKCVINNEQQSLTLKKDVVLGNDSLRFARLIVDSLDMPLRSGRNLKEVGLATSNVAIDRLSVHDFDGSSTLEQFSGRTVCLHLREARLPDCMFMSSSRLEEITIVSSPIQEIGTGAFTGCASLKTITADFAAQVVLSKQPSSGDAHIIGRMPSKIISDASQPDAILNTIAAEADTLELTGSKVAGEFSQLTSIRTLVLSGQNVDVSKKAFANMNLRRVIVSGSLRNVGDYAFASNEELASFKLHQTKRFTVGASSFEGDSKFNISSEFLQKTDSIGPKAFVGCMVPETLFVPVQPTQSTTAFGNNTGKAIVYTASDDELEKLAQSTVQEIVLRGPFSGKHGLSKAKLLTAVTITGDCPFLPRFFFKGLKKLEKIVFESPVKRIGEGAFRNCKSIKKISLPASIRGIGRNAFGYCSNKITVELESLEQKRMLLEDNPDCFVRWKFLFFKAVIKNFTFRKGDHDGN